MRRIEAGPRRPRHPGWPQVLLLLALLLSVGSAMAGTVWLRAGTPFLEPYRELRHFCLPPDRAPAPAALLAAPEAWPWGGGGDSAPTPGFTADTCWFHLRIAAGADAPREWRLVVANPLLDYVELFARDTAGGTVTRQEAGLSLPVAVRPYRYHNFVFPLALAPGEGRDVFLRVRADHIQLPLQLVEARRFEDRARNEVMLQGLFYGGMIVMILYNLLLWLLVRDPVYLLYVLFAAVMTVLQLALHGLAQLYLWPRATTFSHYSVSLLMPLALVFNSLFVLEFLELRRRAPGWSRLLRALMGGGVLLLALVPVAGTGFTDPLSVAGLLVMWVSGLALGVSRSAAGDPEARIFTLAWGCFLTGGILIGLNKFDVLPRNLLTENLLQLGSFLEVVLLSMALARRINRLRSAQVAAERERGQARLEALEAEARSQAKGEFLARMSHEIRTPMNAVLGLAQLMRDTSLTPVQRNYIDTLFNSGEALLAVLNDILDFSKIEAGKLSLEAAPFNLQALLADCMTVFTLNAREKDLQLVSEVDPSLPEWVGGDVIRLRQVLLNLLSNAIKFTPSGRVCLRARVVGPADADPAQLRFEVADTGIGMTREQQRNLFQSFQQADASITRRFGGTGLGLAISRQLVQLMGGAIGVESAPGRGSTFWFEIALPRAEPAPAPDLAAGRSQRLGGLRVLVVEDNAVNRTVITGMLNQLGIRPRVAVNGAEALQVLDTGADDIDLVLMDCEMPELDGYEATRRWRALERERQRRHLPVIALTAHALPEDRMRCLRAGMDDYLTKPVMLEALSARLSAWRPGPRAPAAPGGRGAGEAG
ncbi:MAG TPA: 7TM diverse intracellular signaling domain-containing protein [Moraxellaceae bacterium]|nr:7TM diverse intracellular signaling domain-containing protein [Moraxellaceae bacterium]